MLTLSKPKAFFSALINIIYPKFCLICLNEINDQIRNSICIECINKIRINTAPFCNKCGYSYKFNKLRHNFCEKCYNKNYQFKRLLSVWAYKDNAKKCIHLLKYKRKTKLIDVLGPIMLNFLSMNYPVSEIDIITAVPLHKDKLKKRGFNQARLLAEFIAEKTNIQTDFDSLVRKVNTESQFKLSLSKRLLNIKNSFDIIDYDVFKNKNVLIIDDIFTTGTTLNECSKKLYKAKAKNVFALTMAR